MSDSAVPSKKPRFAVELKLDGEILHLRGFIHDILGGAVYGMIEGLKGFEDCDSLEVKVTRTETSGKTDDQD